MIARKLITLEDHDNPGVRHTVAAYGERFRGVEARAPRLADRVWPSSRTLLAAEGYAGPAVSTLEDILEEYL